MSSHYDRLFASAPISRAAGIVTSIDPESPSDVKLAEHQIHSYAPLPTIPFNDPRKTGRDFTGAKIGRLTVIGFCGRPRPDKPGRWLIRCVCGAYEIRRTPSLRRCEKNPDVAMCVPCDRLRQLKERTAMPSRVSRETSKPGREG